MLGGDYQGNAWWVFIGIGSLVMLISGLLRASRKRKPGLPVDVQAIAAFCAMCLLFLAASIWQVLTHR